MTHLYWFAYHDAHSASVRYRGLYVVEYLKRKFNYSCDFVVPGYSFRNVFQFIGLFIEIVFFKKKDAVLMIQKVHSRGIYAAALRLLVKCNRMPVLFDLDDAEYLRASPESLNYFLKRASICVAGSESLKDYCLQFNRNAVVNTSPVIEHGVSPERRDRPFTIVWIGGYNTNNPVSASFSHKRSLKELFFPALQQIAEPVHLILLGVTLEEDVWELEEIFNHNENIRIEIPLKIDWQDETWVYRQIAKADLGIAPMVDHPFNEAKSAFKAKQYLSCGVPVLASDVGENRRFVKQGENGFLCRNAEEFQGRMQEFMRMDIHTREKFSTSAKASASEFDMDGYCEVIRGIIQSLITPSPETYTPHSTNRYPEGTWISNQSAQ